MQISQSFITANFSAANIKYFTLMTKLAASVKGHSHTKTVIKVSISLQISSSTSIN